MIKAGLSDEPDTKYKPKQHRPTHGKNITTSFAIVNCHEIKGSLNFLRTACFTGTPRILVDLAIRCAGSYIPANSLNGPAMP